MDQGARVLIVDRGHAVLRTVPETTPERNAEREEFQITLQPAGTAQLRVEFRPLGNLAVDLRARLATEPARRDEVVERRLVRTFGKLSLQSLDCSPVLDLAEPVWLTAVATLPGSVDVHSRAAAARGLDAIPRGRMRSISRAPEARIVDEGAAGASLASPTQRR